MHIYLLIVILTVESGGVLYMVGHVLGPGHAVQSQATDASRKLPVQGGFV